MSFPATTTDGEAVMVVEKQTRANQSTVALAEDGRIFEVVGTKLSELADEAKNEASKLFRTEYEIAESHAPVIRAEVAEASGEIRASLGEAKSEIVDSLGEAADEIKESVSEASGVVQKEVAKAVDEMKDAAASALDNINPFDDDDDEAPAEGEMLPYAQVATDPNLEGPKTKPGYEPYAKTSEAPHGEPGAELEGGIPADEQEPPVEQTPDPEEKEEA